MKRSFLVLLFCLLLVWPLARWQGDPAQAVPSRKAGAARKLAPWKMRTNSLGMKLVYLKGGPFRMGDPKDSVASPMHRVTVSSFWIGQFEITNAEYDHFRKRQRFPESLSDRQPATGISWKEANRFCRWLSRKEGRRYRLPTEAEWEYAARGGLDQKKYPWGNTSPEGRATFGRITTTPVGTYVPNGFGLYDMAGNINEWVSDWYDEHYYAHSPRVNPKGPRESSLKYRFNILRGGFYADFELGCAERELWSPDVQSLSGFRVVMNAS